MVSYIDSCPGYHASLRQILYCVLALGGALTLWLVAARPFSLLADRFHTVLLEAPRLDRFRYNNGVLEFPPMTLYTTQSRFDRTAEVALNENGRAILTSGGLHFALGPGHTLAMPTGFLAVDFTPDPGDRIAITVARGGLSWPTPFEMNFMTGVAPNWKRNVYIRLRWSKPSGARLHMLWRDEQLYYNNTGWVPTEFHVNIGGLADVAIREVADLQKGAIEYLSRTKHWSPAEYRLEDCGPSADAKEEIFFARHRADEQAPAPGAGRSVELRVDCRTRRVSREIGGQ